MKSERRTVIGDAKCVSIPDEVLLHDWWYPYIIGIEYRDLERKRDILFTENAFNPFDQISESRELPQFYHRLAIVE